MTFGLVPDGLGAFLAGRGYTLESDVSTRDAGDRLFPGLGRRERGSGLYHVAIAAVRAGICRRAAARCATRMLRVLDAVSRLER